MAIPFYYNPVTSEFESTIESLGTRFGLNEISIARNTLSPTKSYTEGGRLKAAAFLLAPALLPYAATFIGTAATGLMAQKQIQNYFADNPDALPKFKEWVSKFIPTIHGGEELEKIEPVGGKIETWEGSYKDTGIKVPEKLPESKGLEIPSVDIKSEGFPDQSEELNKLQIFTFAKDKKEVKKKLDNVEPYGGAEVIGKSTKKDRTKDKEFLEAFELFKNTHFGGNEAAAARAINESREKIRAIRLRTTTTDRTTGKISTVHEEIITTEVPENPIRYIDATTAVKKDQNYFKNFLTKENKNDHMSAQNIANTLNFKFLDKSERDQFIKMLNDLEVKQKEVPGKRYTSFKLSDVVNKLTEWNRTKPVKGEVLSYTERRKIENKLDADLYSKVLSASKNRTLKILESQNLKLNLKILPRYAVDDIGHVVSIQETDKFPKLFKNSDVNKINSLVYEDPLINQEVKRVTGYEKRYTKFFKELDSLVGKDITAADRKKLIAIRKGMEENYLGLIDNISSPKKLKAILKDARPDITVSDAYIKYLTGHVNRIAKIDIRIPQVGKKFKSEDIFTDMSNVDERYIIGYIDKINSTAKQFKDLSRSEKETYEANILAQNAEIVGDFYKKLGFSANEIEELKDDLYYPMTKYKIRKAGGGPIGLSGVDQYKKGGRTGFDAGTLVAEDVISPSSETSLSKAKEVKKTGWQKTKNILSKNLGAAFSPTGLALLLAWHAKGRDAKEVATDPWTYSYAPFLGVGAEGVEFITKNIKTPAIKSFVQKALSLGVFTPTQIIKASRITTPAGWLAIIGTTLAKMPEDEKSFFLKEMNLGPEFGEKLKEEKEEYYTEGEHYAEGGIASLIK